MQSLIASAPNRPPNRLAIEPPSFSFSHVPLLQSASYSQVLVHCSGIAASLKRPPKVSSTFPKMSPMPPWRKRNATRVHEARASTKEMKPQALHCAECRQHCSFERCAWLLTHAAATVVIVAENAVKEVVEATGCLQGPAAHNVAEAMTSLLPQHRTHAPSSSATTAWLRGITRAHATARHMLCLRCVGVGGGEGERGGRGERWGGARVSCGCLPRRGHWFPLFQALVALVAIVRYPAVQRARRRAFLDREGMVCHEVVRGQYQVSLTCLSPQLDLTQRHSRRLRSGQLEQRRCNKCARAPRQCPRAQSCRWTDRVLYMP